MRQTIQVMLYLSLFRDYIGRHGRLAVQILRSALVLPKVGGLHAFHDDDALGDEGGASHPPVHQPLRALDVHPTLALQKTTLPDKTTILTS